MIETTIISEEKDRDIIPPKLKLCPFDAGGAELISLGHVEFPHFVRCVVCRCRTENFKMIVSAIAAWNQRAE